MSVRAYTTDLPLLTTTTGTHPLPGRALDPMLQLTATPSVSTHPPRKNQLPSPLVSPSQSCPRVTFLLLMAHSRLEDTADPPFPVQTPSTVRPADSVMILLQGDFPAYPRNQPLFSPAATISAPSEQPTHFPTNMEKTTPNPTAITDAIDRLVLQLVARAVRSRGQPAGLVPMRLHTGRRRHRLRHLPGRRNPHRRHHP